MATSTQLVCASCGSGWEGLRLDGRKACSTCGDDVGTAFNLGKRHNLPPPALAEVRWRLTLDRRADGQMVRELRDEARRIFAALRRAG